MAPSDREHVLVAVLFTDIVRSTDLAAEMGDEAWKGLLDQHHVIVRRLVKIGGGRIVDTAGDGVFAVFDRPAAAIRCGFDAIRAVREIGIEIRAGVHFGESESKGGKVSGIAVHTASRVMSLAEPGEVLVTRTVKDLVGGKRIIVTDRGAHELKGIPSTWQVFGVEEVEGSRREPPIEPAEAAERRGRFEHATATSRRAVLIVGVIGMAIVLMAVILIQVGRRPPVASGPSRSLVRLDPVTDERVRVPVGEALTSVAPAKEPSGWHRTPTEASTASTRRPRGSPTVDVQARPNEVTVGDGSVWATTSTELIRIDPASNEIVHRARLGSCPDHDACTTDVSVADGSVWATHYDAAHLLQFDPSNDNEIRRLHLDSPPVTLAAGHGAVWVLLDGIDATVVRVDVVSGATSSETLPAGDAVANCLDRDVGLAYAAEQCGAIVVTERAVWVVTAGPFSSQLWRLDPASGRRVGDPRSLDCCAMAIVATDELIDEIWVGLSTGDLAVVPEALGQQRQAIPVGGTITDVAIGYDAVWVTVHDPPRA
jgi:class 3 adenylate cyclase